MALNLIGNRLDLADVEQPLGLGGIEIGDANASHQTLIRIKSMCMSAWGPSPQQAELNIANHPNLLPPVIPWRGKSQGSLCQ